MRTSRQKRQTGVYVDRKTDRVYVGRKTDRGVCMQKDGQGQKDRRTDMVIPVSLVNSQFSLQKLYCFIKTMVYHVA